MRGRTSGTGPPFPGRLACLHARNLTRRRGGRAERLGVACVPCPPEAQVWKPCKSTCFMWHLACIRFPDASLHLLKGLVDVFYEILPNRFGEFLRPDVNVLAHFSYWLGFVPMMRRKQESGGSSAH